MFVDQAGWHSSRELVIPENVVLLPLPSYSPELNPIERVWLHLKERYLSHRLLDDYDAIVDVVCAAWNKLTDEDGRMMTSMFSDRPDRVDQAAFISAARTATRSAAGSARARGAP
jgi:hypothetical protein